MRVWVMLREVAVSVWANKVPTTLIVLLVASMCAGTLATVGRSAQAQAEVIARMDDSGSRVLALHSRPDDELLTLAVISQAAGLSQVERAGGLGIAFDVTNAHISDRSAKVPAWQVVGDLATYAQLVAGRAPDVGEALISEDAAVTLGLRDQFGVVEPAVNTPGQEWPIVGVFRSREPFDRYGTGVFISASADTPAATMHVLLTDVSHARTVEASVLGLIANLDPTALTIDSPIGLAQLQEQIDADLGSLGRTLLIGVMGAGMFLVGIVTVADVLIRRADLGRRRALGATRITIVALVLGRIVLPALAGAALGTLVGISTTASSGQVPPASFIAGTAILSILVAALGSTMPALFAATRDPVRILRTP